MTKRRDFTVTPRQRPGPKPTGKRKRPLLLHVDRGLAMLVAEAANAHGISASEAWRRAARVWVCLPYEVRATAGAVVIADEDGP